jgi:hypothetical protein
VNKRTGFGHLFGVLAFSSTAFVAVSASAQDTAPPPPPPTTTETAPPPPPPTTTTADPTPPPPPTGNAVTPPPTTVVATTPLSVEPSENIPSFFTSSFTPEVDKASKDKPTAKLRWADSSFFAQIGVSPDVVAPGLVQTYAPVVDSFLLIQPRFAINKDWQLRARLTAAYEFTDNANSTTTQSRTLAFGDFLPEIDYRGIPTFWGKTKVTVAAGAGFPTSPQSQARTMIVSPFAKASIAKVFEKVLGGEVTASIGAIYTRPFYKDTTAGLDDQPAYAAACFGASSDVSCAGQASGAANVENSLTTSALLTAKWGKWSPTVFYFLFNQWTYNFTAQPGLEPEPGGSTNFRQSSYFGASLDYEVNGWFTAEIGYQMFRTILNGSSNIGNPFWDPNQDMRVYLGFNIALDALYEAALGKKDEEGVIRVHNDRKPPAVSSVGTSF